MYNLQLKHYFPVFISMQKYDGLVIYQNHDDEGILEVVEKSGLRSLHFGSSSKQSSIFLNDPEALQLPYTRAMTSWMLFKNTVNEVMMIGLGGGSLARHLLYHFPECHIRAIEYRADVVKIARSHFGLPWDSRLKVIVADGGHYVQQQVQASSGQYDLIMVDAFDVDGLADSIASLAFFDACKTLLRQNGILVMNLWATQTNIYCDCLRWLEQVFIDKVLMLPVRNRGNMIAVAFNASTPRFDLKDLKTRALELEQRFQIEYPKFLKDFLKQNQYTQHSIIKK